MDPVKSYSNDYGGSVFPRIAKARLEGIVRDDYPGNEAVYEHLIGRNAKLAYARNTAILRNEYKRSITEGREGDVAVHSEDGPKIVTAQRVYDISVDLLKILSSTVPGQVMSLGQEIDDFTDQHVNLYVAGELADCAQNLMDLRKPGQNKTAWNLLWDAAYFAPDNWFDAKFEGLDNLTKGYIGLVFCSYLELMQGAWDKRIDHATDAVIDRIVDGGDDYLIRTNKERKDRIRRRGSPAFIARKQTNTQQDINLNLHLATLNLRRALDLGETGIVTHDLLSKAYYDTIINIPEEREETMKGFISHRRLVLDRYGEEVKSGKMHDRTGDYLNECEHFVRCIADFDPEKARDFASAVASVMQGNIPEDRYPFLNRLK